MIASQATECRRRHRRRRIESLQPTESYTTERK